MSERYCFHELLRVTVRPFVYRMHEKLFKRLPSQRQSAKSPQGFLFALISAFVIFQKANASEYRRLLHI